MASDLDRDRRGARPRAGVVASDLSPLRRYGTPGGRAGTLAGVRVSDVRAGRVTRGRDHDPDVLDARAARLDADARKLAPWAVRDVEVRRLVADLRETAALLRRFADDLRVLDAFLRDCDLLAPSRADPEQSDRCLE